MIEMPAMERVNINVEKDPFRGHCEQIESLAELISAYIFGVEAAAFATAGSYSEAEEVERE